MIFKKSDFSFLDVFALCVDNKGLTNDKFQIIGDSKIGEIVFSQMSNGAMVYKVITSSFTEDFRFVFPTIQFNSILKSIPDDSIEIDKNILIFKKSKYEFPVIPFDGESDINFYRELIEKSSPNKEIELKEIDKFAVIKNYMGTEDQSLDTIGVFDGNYMTSNKTSVSSIIKSISEIDNFFVSKLTTIISSACKTSSLVVKDFDKVYSFECDSSVVVVVPKKKYILPNLLDDRIKSAYDHPYSAVISKTDFNDALKRISIVSSTNVDSRVHLTFKDKQLIIESKDSNYAIEYVNGDYSKELENHYLIVSAKEFSNIISSFAGNTVTIKVKNTQDKDNKAISFTDEKNERTFVLCLYPYPVVK